MNPEPKLRKFYSLEERLKIKSLLDQKISVPDIALSLGRSTNGVWSEIKRRGCGMENYDPFYVTDAYTNRRKYTLEERKLLFECIQKGMKRIEISKIMKRSSASIIHQLNKHGGMLGYDPFSVHQGEFSFYTPVLKKDLKSRIENIEMQLEIITTTLQEILDGKNN